LRVRETLDEACEYYGYKFGIEYKGLTYSLPEIRRHVVGRTNLARPLYAEFEKVCYAKLQQDLRKAIETVLLFYVLQGGFRTAREKVA